LSKSRRQVVAYRVVRKTVHHIDWRVSRECVLSRLFAAWVSIFKRSVEIFFPRPMVRTRLRSSDSTQGGDLLRKKLEIVVYQIEGLG